MRWFSKILDNILGWYAKILTITYRGIGCLEKAKNIYMYRDPSFIYTTGIKNKDGPLFSFNFVQKELLLEFVIV